MGKSYREYSDERRKNRSPEAVEAGQVFHEAYSVAAALMAARQRAGMTQTEVAAKCGVDQADISRIERAQLVPTTMTLAKIMAALGGRITLDFGAQEQVVISPEPAITNMEPDLSDADLDMLSRGHHATTFRASALRR